MKHLILLILLTTIYISKTSAQIFNAGIIAGTSITDIDGSDLVDHDNDFHKWGFTFGGLVNAKISKASFFQMELAYIQKGTYQPLQTDSTGKSISYKIALNYIDVSLLLKHKIKFNIDKKKISKFGIEEGITLGTLVNDRYTFNSSDLPIPNGTYNKIDLSLLLGINYNFTDNFFLSFRYSNSIVHAIKHTSNYFNFYPFATFNKGNNLVFQLTLGYVFNKKNKDKDKDIYF